MHCRSASHLRGFTLLELILVIAIIGLLAGMLMPVTLQIVERANTIKCANNLRQIGMAVNLAATDNDNIYPKIEIDVKNPIYLPEDNALPLDKALVKYGISGPVLQCPTDLKDHNHFAELGTSYMWQPYSEDEPTASITIYSRRGTFPGRQSRVRLATDYEVEHIGPQDASGSRKRFNTVYADGHVVLR